MNNDQTTPKSFLPGHLSWLTVVLALLALGTFIAVSGPGVRYGGIIPMMQETGGVQMGVSSAPGAGMMRPDVYPYPYPNSDVPITDTREFLKIYYNASMRTRDVQGLTRRVETTVRGYSGRIDQESLSSQYGSVSFSIPQSKYDAFRAEIEAFVGSRFLTLNISSQNLLPQKVSIEEQQKQADTALADYKTARQKLVATHASAVQSLQSQIDETTKQRRTLEEKISTPQIVAEIQIVSDRQLYLQKQLASENASYTTQLSNADANIKYAQDWQKAVQTQDQTLLNNVATVTGAVSVQWISLWDIALLYLPGYWIPTIFAALALLSYLNDRRRRSLY